MEDIVDRWREYFNFLLNPVTPITSDAQDLGEVSSITATEISLAVKTLKAG